MKKSLNSIMFAILLLGFIAYEQQATAQAPPPPPAEKGTNTNKAPGGGAPIDGGLAITLSLAAGYGIWKLIAAVQRKRQSI
ncbi:MAG: PID-CTERM protein-sorting domain-containing protein [Bacteroidales bacterium]